MRLKEALYVLICVRSQLLAHFQPPLAASLCSLPLLGAFATYQSVCLQMKSNYISVRLPRQRRLSLSQGEEKFSVPGKNVKRLATFSASDTDVLMSGLGGKNGDTVQTHRL